MSDAYDCRTGRIRVLQIEDQDGMNRGWELQQEVFVGAEVSPVWQSVPVEVRRVEMEKIKYSGAEWGWLVKKFFAFWGPRFGRSVQS